MTIVTNGTRTFRKLHEFAGDRPALVVANYPVMLRAVARQLARKDCWLAGPIDEVARDWNDDAAPNVAKLQEVLAHDDLFTPAQVSRIRAALQKLHERTNNDV